MNNSPQKVHPRNFPSTVEALRRSGATALVDCYDTSAACALRHVGFRYASQINQFITKMLQYPSIQLIICYSLFVIYFMPIRFTST